MAVATYPRLIRRVQASLVDSVLLPVGVVLSLILGESLGVISGYGKVLLVVLPIFLLDPALVSLTGGTIGHHLLKIRVATRDSCHNINLIAATIRFLVKVLLGWVSLIFVLTTSRHQAVHDLLARSVVLHKDSASLPAHEVLSERTQETHLFVYPPPWRRALIIALYWILVTIVIWIVNYLALSTVCLEKHQCTTIDYLLNISLNIAWLIGLGWATVLGWNGRLLGCRRRLRS